MYHNMVQCQHEANIKAAAVTNYCWYDLSTCLSSWPILQAEFSEADYITTLINSTEKKKTEHVVKK